MSICNMAIEAGARAGLIAPDDITFDYIKGRPMAPSGEAWDKAVAQWKQLRADEGAVYDRTVEINAADVRLVSLGSSRVRSACVPTLVHLCCRLADSPHSDLGHQPTGHCAHHRNGARPSQRPHRATQGGHGTLARLHGAHSGPEDGGCKSGQGTRWLHGGAGEACLMGSLFVRRRRCLLARVPTAELRISAPPLPWRQAAR